MARDATRILHVDDDADFGELVSIFLKREEGTFEVVSETCVADGLDRLEQSRIDCVVCDYDMPGRNGLEFLEAVQESYPEIPFILFAGKGSEEIRQHSDQS
ncbi:response regulator [Halomarina salina]|uniref:Response regulator n=1 Tax=Halomarina salina TaxID=1872699 RepID=A0ABD5RHD6_9EURY|nr:response regulator [Halomarina salina]